MLTTITGGDKDYEAHSRDIVEREMSLGAVSSAVGVMRAALCMAHLCTDLASMVSALCDPSRSTFSF